MRREWVVIACVILCVGLWQPIAVAQPADAPSAEATAPTEESSPTLRVLGFLLEHAFELTIVLVFLTAIISSYLSRRLSDRCLKHMAGFPVTLEFKDGTRRRGILDAENNGLELCYFAPEREEDEVVRESYILYKEEYPSMQALICYPELLDEAQRRRREKAIRRAYSPNLFRRIGRRLRNFVAAVKDAFAEAFTLILGRLKSAGPQAQLLQQQDKYVSKVGTQIIGASTAATYDPLLERQIGKRVDVDVVVADKSIVRHVGLLKEYSKEFVELQDAQYPDGWPAVLAGDAAEEYANGVRLRRADGALELSNDTVAAVQIEIMKGMPAGESGENPKVVIAADSTERVPIESPDAEVRLEITCRKSADVLMPRHSAIVRGKVSDGHESA